MSEHTGEERSGMFTALREICMDFSSEGSDWMKRTVVGALVALLFLAGLSLLAYPFVANEWNNNR